MQNATMYYKFGGDVELQDGKYSTHVVDADDPEQVQAVLDSGWHLTPADARAAYILESEGKSEIVPVPVAVALPAFIPANAAAKSAKWAK